MSIFGTPVIEMGGSVSGMDVTTGSTVDTSVGDLIVVMLSAFLTGNITSVTDNAGAGNTYTALTQRSNSGAIIARAFYTVATIASATNTITVHCDAVPLNAAMVIWDVPITGSAPIFDVEAFVANAAANPAVTNSVNTNGTDEIVFGLAENSNGNAFSNGPGWTFDGTPNGLSGCEHILLASPQTGFTGEIAASPAAQSIFIIAAFQAPGVSPMAATITGTSAVTGALTGSGALASSIAGASAVTGALTGSGALASGIQGVASVVANANEIDPISASINGQGTVTGELDGLAALLASIHGRGSVIADLTGFIIESISCNIDGIGSVVAFLTGSAPLKNGQQIPYVLRDFGVSTRSPAYLSTNGNGLMLFNQPSFIPRVSAGTVTPPQWSTPGTPDNFNYQGRVQAPGQLLVAPGNGSLSGKIYNVVAEGMIFTPQSAINPSVDLVMLQNYFTFGQSEISDELFSLSVQAPLTPGTMVGFKLVSTLAGNGVGSSVLSCAGALNVDGSIYYGNGFSNRLVNREPIVQLSIGMQFNGMVDGPDTFQAFLSRFEISIEDSKR